MPVKFQKVRGTDTTLDRVQDNIGAALADLESRITALANAECCGIPAPTPGVVPPGFSTILQFGGFNTGNATRILNLGPSVADVAANTGSTPQVTAPFAGTLQNLIVQLTTAYPNGGGVNETKFTVRVGNSNTALETDWTAADIGAFQKSDATHSVAVAAGALISVTSNPLTMGGAFTNQSFASVVLVAT